MNNRKKLLNKRLKLIVAQILLFVFVICLWEFFSKVGILDNFLFSSPSSILSLLLFNLKQKEFYNHIYISLLETILGIIIGSAVGIIIAVVLWSSKTITKLLEPFMVVLNALPKTALAPIMIIWAGAGVTGIVVVAISILLVITILSTYNYFINVDAEKIKMMRSFQASRYQIFTKLVFPANLVNIISVIKINIGMSWVGVIVGEFLVSRVGIGHEIMYGGQIFRFDIVMMWVIVLSFFAYIMYEGINIIEKILIKKRGKGI